MEDKKRDSSKGREWGIIGGIPEKYTDPAEKVFGTIMLTFLLLLIVGIWLIAWKWPAVKELLKTF